MKLPRSRILRGKRAYLAALLAGTIVCTLLLANAGKSQESMGEFLREHSQFQQRRLPLALLREKIGESGEASTEVLAGPAQERYENRAYPNEHVEYAQAMGSKLAFQAARERAGLVGVQSAMARWQEVGPTTAYVPATQTYTGVATTTSGRVTAIAVSNTCNADLCRVWVGAAGGGVWATDNGLAEEPQWRSSSDGLLSNAIGSLLIDPTDASGRTLYAGTGEANGSSDSEAGVGLFKSTDFGRTWTLVPGSVAVSKDRSVAAVAVDPVNANHIYLGTAVARHGASSVNGGRFTPPHAPRLGLYESTDGGATFALIFSRTADNMNPGTPNGSDFFRGGITKIETDRLGLRADQASRLYFSLFSYGVYRRNPDASVEQVFASAGQGTQAASIGSRTEFALAPMGDRLRIYVGDTDGNSPADLYRVDNANVPGSTLTDGTSNAGWIRLSNADPASPGFGSYNYCGDQCSYDMPVASPPGQPDHVWIGGQMLYDEIFTAHAPSNGRAVQRSANAGASFTDMTNDAQNLGMHPDQHVITFAPGNPNIAFIGSDGGVVRTSGAFADKSADCNARGLTGQELANCRAWLGVVPTRIFSLNAGLATLQFMSVSINPQNAHTDVMGGTQDNGTWAYDAAGARWFETMNGDGGQSGVDAVNPDLRLHTYYGPSPEINYQGTNPLGWNWIADPLYASREAASFYVPLVADPVVSGTAFVGLERVWRTRDNGGPQAYLEKHCNDFIGDFKYTCGDWTPLGGLRLTGTAYGRDKTGSYVVAIARTPADQSTLWAATRRGRLFVSKNADARNNAAVTFKRIDSPAQPTRFISGITVDPANPNHAFVSYSGYNAYTPATPGHVFEVTYNASAGTATWVDRSYDLGDMPITAIALDGRTGRLYAATDWGVLKLEAGGTTWTTAAQGLPPAAVYGLTLATPDGVLYAATHGRGIWKLALDR